ncbi:hypothetical protein PSTG_06675 [Puccinia striiformis f. sp. tritici PST-78]|uniref:Uncharacterized protein n=1 Tax=Puccinia striiformis f. sp. tritici PST-78 TaxID=1165861 RepID=A0A0L0VLB1_9BASI|nr:hypothetical protein PSTG_06675 [Puccinia striiformis f. sp. tritici PST-78]
MVRCSLHVRIRLQTSRILWSHCARGNDVVCAGHIASLGWADHATSMPVQLMVEIETSDQLLRTKLEIDLDIDEFKWHGTLQENIAQLTTVDIQYYKGAFVILHVNSVIVPPTSSRSICRKKASQAFPHRHLDILSDCRLVFEWHHDSFGLVTICVLKNYGPLGTAATHLESALFSTLKLSLKALPERSTALERMCNSSFLLLRKQRVQGIVKSLKAIKAVLTPRLRCPERDYHRQVARQRRPTGCIAQSTHL